MQLYSVTNTDKVLLHLCADCTPGAFTNLGFDDDTLRIFFNGHFLILFLLSRACSVHTNQSLA